MPDRLIIDGAAVQKLLTGPQGPVARELEYVGSAVQTGARSRIRPSMVRGEGGGLSLRDSVVKRLLTGPWLTMRVIAQKPYAYFLHEGTPPHEIRPRRVSALRFYSQRAAGFVFARVVHHPGTKPNRYLSDSTREVFTRRYHSD